LEDTFWCFWGVCCFDDDVVLVFLGFSCTGKVFFDVLVFPMECLDFDFWSFKDGVFLIDVGFEVLTPWISKNKVIFS
jgi:hypothetical protein